MPLQVFEFHKMLTFFAPFVFHNKNHTLINNARAPTMWVFLTGRAQLLQFLPVLLFPAPRPVAHRQGVSPIQVCE